jgi:hypothetical protein
MTEPEKQQDAATTSLAEVHVEQLRETEPENNISTLSLFLAVIVSRPHSWFHAFADCSGHSLLPSALLAPS